MSKVIYTYKNYIALDTGDAIILKDSKGKYENHAHFDKRTDKRGNINLIQVFTVIRLCIGKRTDIKSKYLMRAIIRLTTDIDYRENLERLYKKKFSKDNYINVNRGVRK